MAETLQPTESVDTRPLNQEEVRALQLRASGLQLRIQVFTAEERKEYEKIMATLQANNADDWGD